MFTIEELAEKCKAKIIGGNPKEIISSVSSITNAGWHQITQLTDKRYLKHLSGCKASACLISEELINETDSPNIAFLVCSDPEVAYIDITNLLHPCDKRCSTIDNRAAIAKSANLGNQLHIGAYAIIEENASIGDNSTIFGGAFIGRNVKIGKNCTIHPYAVLYDNVILDNNVIIHSGAIIGADGFGYKRRKNGLIKVPQIGSVIIEDDVEIGANTCIDRGACEETHIGSGTKIDNLVQVGHNDIIGNNVIICGQSGIAGSCTIEDNATLAASSGIADHLHIGKNAIIMARSGVANDINENQIVFGTPAKDKRSAWREISALSNLPDLFKRIKNLEEKLSKFENVLMR